jgi:hypothetical protein
MTSPGNRTLLGPLRPCWGVSRTSAQRTLGRSGGCWLGGSDVVDGSGGGLEGGAGDPASCGKEREPPRPSELGAGSGGSGRAGWANGATAPGEGPWASRPAPGTSEMPAGSCVASRTTATAMTPIATIPARAMMTSFFTSRPRNRRAARTPAFACHAITRRRRWPREPGAASSWPASRAVEPAPGSSRRDSRPPRRSSANRSSHAIR